MHNKIKELKDEGIIEPPDWVANNLCLLVTTGSHAYGCASDDSDLDCKGIAVPPLDCVFPHLRGVIWNFGSQIIFKQEWCHHHLFIGKQEYDFSIDSLIKFMNLTMRGNPNCLDLLYVPQKYVMYCNVLGGRLRDNRSIFLSKQCWPSYKGFAYGRLAELGVKIKKNEEKMGKIIKYGFDPKIAYHIVRAVFQAEEILKEGNLTLNRNASVLIDIREGKWSEDEIVDFFLEKQFELDKIYNGDAAVPEYPDENKVKDLLLECLRRQYGNLEGIYHNPDQNLETLRKIRDLLSEAQI